MGTSTVSRHHKIRPATQEDVPDLLGIENACFVGYYASHRFSPSHFKAYLRNGRAILFVAAGSSSLLGYIAGHVKPGRPIASARMDSIAVASQARHRGIGTLLLQRFLAEARRQGCRAVALEVAVANEGAVRFFSRLGFRPYRRLPAYYSPAHDGIRMKLTM